MKPLIIIEFNGDSYTPEYAKKFDDYIIDNEQLREYDVLVLWGGKAKVYYPFKITFWKRLKATIIKYYVLTIRRRKIHP